MKLNVKKGLMSLLMVGYLVLNREGINAKAATYNQGDQVRTTSNVDMQIDDSMDSDIVGFIGEGEKVYRILSTDNGYDLVWYNNTIGYVNNEYLFYEKDFDKDVIHYEIKDILKTTTRVNFRSMPTTDSKVLCVIPKGAEVISVSSTDNGWYLVEYGGQLGYVYTKYTKSLLDYVKSIYPDLEINEIEGPSIVYATTKLNIRSGASIDSWKIGMLNKNECARVIGQYGDWYLILDNDNNLGFINKNYTSTIKDVHVIVDISDQRLDLYNNSELVLSTSVTTGKDSTPTTIGNFKIYYKEEDRYLVGDDYRQFVEYWMPFNGGIGLHDAGYRSSFGGEIYHENGSHGCVNIPPKVARKIYKKVSIGTPVVVQK